jgi:hypothetical protein
MERRQQIARDLACRVLVDPAVSQGFAAAHLPLAFFPFFMIWRAGTLCLLLMAHWLAGHGFDAIQASLH